MANSTGTAYHEYRPDITPMLSFDKSMLQAVIREDMRTMLGGGRLREYKYAYAFYKKVKRITIPCARPR